VEKNVSQEHDEMGLYVYIYRLWLKRWLFAIIAIIIAIPVYLLLYTNNEYEINAVIKTNRVSLPYNNMNISTYAVHPELIIQLIKLKALDDEKNMLPDSLRMKKLYEDTDIQFEFFKETDLIKIFFITRNADQGIELLQWILARLEIKTDQEKSRNFEIKVDIKTYASLLSAELEVLMDGINQLRDNRIADKSLIRQKINNLESQIIIKKNQIKQIEELDKIKAIEFIQNPKIKLLREPNRLKITVLSILIGLSMAVIIVFVLNGFQVFYTEYIKSNKSISGNNRQ